MQQHRLDSCPFKRIPFCFVEFTKYLDDGAAQVVDVAKAVIGPTGPLDEFPATRAHRAVRPLQIPDINRPLATGNPTGST